MAESITGARDSLAIKIIRYWLPVFVMIGLMYYFSTGVLSGENTRSLFERILDRLGFPVSEETGHRINFVVRKCAHFIEYGLLAGLLYRAFRADQLVRWRFRWAVYSLLASTLWALADEYHQTLVRDRTGSIKDAILDSAGALFALYMIARYYKKKNV